MLFHEAVPCGNDLVRSACDYLLLFAIFADGLTAQLALLTSFEFFDTFVALPLAGCSSLVLALLSFRHTLMQPGLVILLIVTLSLLIVSSLGPP